MIDITFKDFLALNNSMRVEISKSIIADPEICHGKPVFKGTRIMVGDIIELLASGERIEKIIEEYPSLKKEMIMEALHYSARVIKGEHYAKFSKVPA